MIIIPELGVFSLILAFCLACVMAFRPSWGPGHFDTGLFWTQVGLIFLGFFVLMLCFVQNNFSVEYVAANSNTQLPLVYKLCALWGAHEGSLLLWIAMLSGWMIVAKRLQQDHVLAILAAISAGFLFLLLHTANPFSRILPLFPEEGNDLNPLLQDFGFFIHPPFLYLGYVGFAVPFAYSLAALSRQQDDGEWIPYARGFALLAWGALTIGMVLGSWWAYYELGWGGWWFWDPVENASLMPWLTGAALCHALMVSERKKSLLGWTHGLAIGTFLLSLMGTFLVRSGMISSVHAFASDPTRGTYILGFIFLVCLFSLWRYVMGYRRLEEGALPGIFSKEAGIILGNVILVAMALTVLLGTLYPLAMEVLFEKRLSVGAPYFRALFAPLLVILVLLMILVPCVFSRKKLRISMMVAHMGLGVALIGMVLVNALETETETVMPIGGKLLQGEVLVTFEALTQKDGSNFQGVQGRFTLDRAKQRIGTLFPEKRYFPAREITMTETAIRPGFWEDYYIALGEPYEDGRWSVRVYTKPFIRWIWLGGLMIACSAIFSGVKVLWPLRKAQCKQK